MNRRDNFQGIINHWEPERVLIDFGKHIGSFHRNAYERLKSDLGTKTKTRMLDRMAQNVVLDERNCELPTQTQGPNSACVMPMTCTGAPVGRPSIPQPSWQPVNDQRTAARGGIMGMQNFSEEI